MPGYQTAGSHPDLWDKERTEFEINGAIGDGCQLVLPITTLIETGNHIAHSDQRYETATRFVAVLAQASIGEIPWTPFADQLSTIKDDALSSIREEWPAAAARGVSIGDFLITSVADYYSRGGFEVRILTSDTLLRSHVPAQPVAVPRRRRLGE